MKKTFVEIGNILFPLEDVLCIKRKDNWKTENDGNRIYYTYVYLNGGVSFYINDEEYDWLKEAILKVNSKNQETKFD